MNLTGLFNHSKMCYLMILLLTWNIAYPQTRTKLNSFDELIKSKSDENHIPGIAACIIKDNELEWSNAYGWADIENKVPMSTESIINIASISKTITATAIMQLWERGQLKLDTDINDYLPINIRNPKFPDTQITIRNLLTHTSSINDGSAYYDSYSCGDPQISLKYWVTNYLTKEGKFYNEKDNFHPWKPGDKFRYSNVGFGLLGYIIEEVSKMLFNKYCNHHIFTPLKMTNSGWFISEIDETNHAIPYTYVNLLQKDNDQRINNNVPHCLYSFANYPDGLLRTSVEDLSHYLLAIMNGGLYGNEQILRHSTIEDMLTLQIEGNSHQGLCWAQYGSESLWGHGGSDPGVRTNVSFNPETKIGAIVFMNNNTGNPLELAKQLYLSAIDEGN